MLDKYVVELEGLNIYIISDSPLKVIEKKSNEPIDLFSDKNQLIGNQYTLEQIGGLKGLIRNLLLKYNIRGYSDKIKEEINQKFNECIENNDVYINQNLRNQNE